MYADTAEELHAMAARLGLRRSWCSDVTHGPNHPLLHYDLNRNKHRQAVALGAIQQTFDHMISYKRCNREEEPP